MTEGLSAADGPDPPAANAGLDPPAANAGLDPPAANAGLEIDCLIEADGWGGETGVLAAAARRGARAAAADQLADGLVAELTLVLSDDAAVRRLNARWRGRDTATNVLAFANCTSDQIDRAARGGPPLLLGDVVLALSTCCAEAARDGKSVGDHVAHLAVHGVLHLFGHDHVDTGHAARMEARETAILAGLGIADPYGDADFECDRADFTEEPEQ